MLTWQRNSWFYSSQFSQSSLLTLVLFTTTADAAEIVMKAKKQVIFSIVPHGLVHDLKCWQAITLLIPHKQ